MRNALFSMIMIATFLMSAVPVSAQQIEMFPPGPYVTHCRAIDDKISWGGDDDHNNIYFFLVDPSIADGTSKPDFYIHLWDGDNNATGVKTGTQDYDIHNKAGHSVFEYRFYGGPGAYDVNEAPPGNDPTTWTGTLIDIDSDPGDDTLRTDDPDDIDGTAPEDLRDLDYSLIMVDMDANPGDLVGGMMAYKFVVDGTFGPGGEWNRYEIQITRDAGRTDQEGIWIFVYELTYAGRPSGHGKWTNLAFIVPGTPTQEIDIQTLDMDRKYCTCISTVSTPSVFYDDASTYESDDQYVNGEWMWTSLNQQVTPSNGDGVTGVTYPTAGEEGKVWTLDIDAGLSHNPLSIKLNDRDGNWLPLFIHPVFVAYGSGPISLAGTALPKSGGSAFTLEAAGATPNTPGLLFVGTEPHDLTFPNGLVLYVKFPIQVIFNVSFDATGCYSMPAAIPSGVPGIDLFLQTFALSSPPEHSNGLRMTIVP